VTPVTNCTSGSWRHQYITTRTGKPLFARLFIDIRTTARLMATGGIIFTFHFI